MPANTERSTLRCEDSRRAAARWNETFLDNLLFCGVEYVVPVAVGLALIYGRIEKVTNRPDRR